ncbi:MAG: FixH family protein [Acidobacteriaceae bacterium]|nr:FixH family protein [Acidobacteriaceae bacterium]
MKSIRILLVFLIAAEIIFADGGTLVLRKQAGPLTISIFSSPEPLRVGPADLSVMVQKRNDKSEVLDAKVSLHLTHSNPDGIAEVFARATHANATNKLLYASRVNLASAGVWRLAAMVDSKNGSAEVAGEVTVRPPQPPILAYWPYFTLVPLIIALFVVNQWLKGRRKLRRPLARA